LPGEASYETSEPSSFKVDEGTRSLPSHLLKSTIFQEFLEEIETLRMDILHLNNEIQRDRQRIMNLERGKKSYGKNVKKRVESMLLLIGDYGGSLKSSLIKKYMGLSKDELYRTLKCAREEGLIEALPDPQDRRGSLIRIIKEP
jgi:DNA-binding MarR family transcriptional regulator